MGLVWIYLAALIAFLAIDAVAINAVIRPIFQTHIGDLLRPDMRMGVALGFYVFYVAAVVYLAVMPALAEQSAGRALINGAVLGFAAYGTYEATNMATLKGWSWSMLITDLSWGTILTAGVAGIGYAVGRWVA